MNYINAEISLNEIVQGLTMLPYDDIIEMISMLDESVGDSVFSDMLKGYITENKPDHTWNCIKEIKLPSNGDIVTIYTSSEFKYSSYYKDKVFYTLDTTEIISIPITEVSYWIDRIFNKKKLLNKFYSTDDKLNLPIIEQIINSYIKK